MHYVVSIYPYGGFVYFLLRTVCLSLLCPASYYVCLSTGPVPRPISNRVNQNQHPKPALIEKLPVDSQTQSAATSMPCHAVPYHALSWTLD
ncbi:hypothetical protein LZ31DRAFT_548878 [Colletotrichum somersetense]|nr:hypothetical protein LZ31DRAFT_548878 [Colletotrichum somersetense]